MATLLLESRHGFLNKNNQQFIELFGLAKSGKTTLYEELLKKGYKGFLFDKFFIGKKLFYFLKFLIKNPLRTSYLFYKINSNWIALENLKFRDYLEIFSMRNSYLIAVLAKYEIVKNLRNLVFIDEFLLQSIFMIKQQEANKKEMMEILDLLPKSNKILLVEASSQERSERFKKIKKFARKLNSKYRKVWIRNSEFNYKIIRELLFELYNVKKFDIERVGQL